MTGVVRSITNYGAFVELEKGIEGLVHVSDMSWTRKVRHPKELLSKGEEVDVKVLDVSKDERKISLGLKQVEEDPWPKIKEKYSIGTTTNGKVERILNKGIIVNLDLDVEGIVPLSHIPKKDRKQMTQNVQVGDELELKVIDINEDDKKIVLSRDEFIQDKEQHDVDMFLKTQEGDVAEKIDIPEEVRRTIEEGEEGEQVDEEEPDKSAEEPAEDSAEAEEESAEEVAEETQATDDSAGDEEEKADSDDEDSSEQEAPKAEKDDSDSGEEAEDDSGEDADDDSEHDDDDDDEEDENEEDDEEKEKE
ncbi:MAG: 30S ribosomal protein S1 [Candidatus Marinimicrobia bacterium]|nr:30S ribosomal protein S1 [Candidatus Neomarinimicrobiota bacterium]